jgi:hypothetical protein
MDRLMAAVLFLSLCLAATALNAKKHSGKPLSGNRIICVWSVEARTDQEMAHVVEQAAALGFNAISWDRPELPAICRARGLKSFALLCPLARRPGARLQVMAAGEDSLPGFDPPHIPTDQFYQFGGEPVAGHSEILDQNFTCPNDTGVVNYTLAEVERLRRAGYDGILFDFVGYRNYRSCECAVCKERLTDWRASHSGLNARDAAARFYAEQLITLYDTLYDRTKALVPGLILGNHIHPVYLPDLFYGLRVKVDLAGITTAWFFQPHWPLEKVKEYTHRVVDGPYRFGFTQGMPMLGFYTDGVYARDRKSAARLREELRIIKQAGAQHIVMCELGHLLRDSAAGQVVKEELAGER